MKKGLLIVGIIAVVVIAIGITALSFTDTVIINKSIQNTNTTKNIQNTTGKHYDITLEEHVGVKTT